MLDIGKVDNKHYDYSEFLNAFGKLHANIYFSYHNLSIPSVAICSPTQKDGKSTIALYLAKAIAATGKKVLLVDGNSFSYQIPHKLISANKAEENLFVLCTSQKVFNNAVERERMMNEFKAEYDFVIYDTPPLLDSVTAGFLSADTDGIVLVAAIGSTKKSLFLEALEQVKTFNLPLLGIVANHAGSGQLQDDKTDKLSDLDLTKFFKSSNNNNYLEPKRKS